MSVSSVLGICEEVFASPKYSTLYRPLVQRICEEEYNKYNNAKDRLKGTKKTLHAMYGAYLTPDSYKKANKLMSELVIDEDRDVLERILRLHASTKERLQDLAAFYSFIFETTGKAETVLDIGCGFNPLTMSYFPKGNDLPKKYYAIDIDERIAQLNNRYFSFLGMPKLADCEDITAQTPKNPVDVAFLFKLLPLIERQSRGRSAQLIKELDAQFLVITYPTKSLTGKEKGMKAYYETFFEELINGHLFIAAKKQIGIELVYVLSKKQ